MEVKRNKISSKKWINLKGNKRSLKEGKKA